MKQTAKKEQKLNTLGNRGRALEDLLEAAFDSDSETCMFRQSNRIVLLRDGRAFPQKGAPVDFVGVVRGVPVVVECKETKANRLPLNKSRFPENEITALQRFSDSGGSSFVVAAFWKHNRIAVFSFRTFKGLMSYRKSVYPEDADVVFPVSKVKKITEVFQLHDNISRQRRNS